MAEHPIPINQRQATEIAARSQTVKAAQDALLLYLTGIVQGADEDLSAMTGYRVTSDNGVYQLRVTVPEIEPKAPLPPPPKAAKARARGTR